jgi:hypothetical protein
MLPVVHRLTAHAVLRARPSDLAALATPLALPFDDRRCAHLDPARNLLLRWTQGALLGLTTSSLVGMRVANALRDRFLREPSRGENATGIPAVGNRPEGAGVQHQLGDAGTDTRAVRSRGERDYVESSKQISRCGRYGFAVTDEVRVPRSGPLMWVLWRDPR